jgi:hypothetical protein
VDVSGRLANAFFDCHNPDIGVRFNNLITQALIARNKDHRRAGIGRREGI